MNEQHEITTSTKYNCQEKKNVLMNRDGNVEEKKHRAWNVNEIKQLNGKGK